MASPTTLARPYAKAAFEHARDGDRLAQWSHMLAFAAAIATDERAAMLLDDPRLSAEQQAKLFADIGGDAMDDHFNAFLGLLADNERLVLLPDILALFEHMRAEAEKRLTVRVISAVELSDDQKGRLGEALARRMGREIELECSLDSKLLGGAVIYAGDTVIDGSLSAKLQRLRAELGVERTA